MKSLFFLVLLLFYYNINFSQNWEYNISKDYVYQLRDKWGDFQRYIAKFTVSNDSTVYFHQIKGEKDKWIVATFPEDFILLKGTKEISYTQKFILKVEVLKEVVFTDTITFYPGPKGFFQLQPLETPEVLRQKLYNQLIIDAYTWDDTLGANYFIRTETISEKTKHLYFYHFVENKKEIFLLRKHLDYIKNCDNINNTNHILESIQITDLNEDMVAEIIFSYNIGCVEYCKKIILMSEGKKYFIRGNKEDEKTYKIGIELHNEKEFMRFMEKKWRNESINK